MKTVISILFVFLTIPCWAGIITIDANNGKATTIHSIDSNNPDLLLEAQLLALEVEGQLQPSAELTEQIYNDLAAIRSTYPDVAHITFRPRAVPDEIIVGITQEAAEQFRNGQYHALDELNELYGVIEIRTHFRPSYSFLILKFNQVYNTQLLSQIYTQANLEGVRYAEPNGHIGDGPTIVAEPPFYIFINAWGDCPSGCIYHEYWSFKVEEEQAVLLSELYVDSENGDDNNLGLTPKTAFATIQKGIHSAQSGDTVIVADGTYTGPGNRDINFLGKAITVRSIDPNDPNIVTATIIDCNGTETEPHRGFYFHSGEDSNSVLDGFTITGGYGPAEEVCSQLISVGGAIFCKASSPRISNCIITNSYAIGYGGGMFNCENSCPTLINCSFISNRSSYHGRGGAMVNDKSSPTLLRCSFIANRGGNSAGAIQNTDSNAVLTNCTFTGNFAPIACVCYTGGGAIHNRRGSPVLTNCTFTGNYAVFGGAVFNNESTPKIINCTFSDNIGGGNAICNLGDTCNPIVRNCILWNLWDYSDNEILNLLGATINITYSDVQGGWPGLGNGNIDVDPCFVGPAGYWHDNNTPADPTDDFWVDGDYHLLPDSPCINTGDPNYIADPNETDLDGQPRIFLGRVDIGADEFVPSLEVPMHFTPRKLNPKSKGKWIKAHLVLPEDFTVEDVNTNSPARIVEPFTADSVYMDVFLNEDGLVKIMAAFDRADFCSNGSAQGNVVVIGRLTNGQYFYGTDTIRIKTNNLEYLAVLTSYWLEAGCVEPDWCEGADLNRDSVVDFIDFAFFDGCCLEFIKN